MNVVIRPPGAEERPVQELTYGAHNLLAGPYRIKTPDGQIRDIDAEAPLTITVLRPAPFPDAGPEISISLQSRSRDCCFNFFARRSHDIDCPDGRPIPEDLAPFMRSDPAVVALVFAWQRGEMDEAAMWKALALHQTKAAEEARKFAGETLRLHGQPLVLIPADRKSWAVFDGLREAPSAPVCDCDVASGGGLRHKPSCPAHQQNAGSP